MGDVDAALHGGPTEDRDGFVSLGELAAVFLRLSLLGFGGPNAHIALMLDEVVDRRRWLTRAHFLELVSITNLLPGPNSSEVAIHIGHVKRGVPGALVTGGVFLMPAFVIVTALAWLYFGPLGDLPALDPVFALVKPVVLALIFRAAWKLGRTAVDDGTTAALATVGTAVGALAGAWAVPTMLAGGAVTWALGRRSADDTGEPGADSTARSFAFPIPLAAAQASPGPGWVPAGLLAFLAAGSAGAVFLLTFGIGAVLFGGGYTLVALLQPTAVDAFGWLTTEQFLDGVALTQAVPGPISTLAAFVGFAAAGVPGAVAGVVGVYLPAFVAVLAVAPLLDRLRRQAAVKAALRGIGAVVAGTIVGVAITLVPAAVGLGALVDGAGAGAGTVGAVALPIAVAVASFVALVRGWVGPGSLIAGALLAGVGMALLG